MLMTLASINAQSMSIITITLLNSLKKLRVVKHISGYSGIFWSSVTDFQKPGCQVFSEGVVKEDRRIHKAKQCTECHIERIQSRETGVKKWIKYGSDIKKPAGVKGSKGSVHSMRQEVLASVVIYGIIKWCAKELLNVLHHNPVLFSLSCRLSLSLWVWHCMTSETAGRCLRIFTWISTTLPSGRCSRGLLWPWKMATSTLSLQDNQKNLT